MRINKAELSILRELEKRKQNVQWKFYLFSISKCSICEDGIVREKIWEVARGTRWYCICKRCAPTWEKAYDLVNP